MNARARTTRVIKKNARAAAPLPHPPSPPRPSPPRMATRALATATVSSRPPATHRPRLRLPRRARRRPLPPLRPSLLHPCSEPARSPLSPKPPLPPHPPPSTPPPPPSLSKPPSPSPPPPSPPPPRPLHHHPRHRPAPSFAATVPPATLASAATARRPPLRAEGRTQHLRRHNPDASARAARRRRRQGHEPPPRAAAALAAAASPPSPPAPDPHRRPPRRRQDGCPAARVCPRPRRRRLRFRSRAPTVRRPPPPRASGASNSIRDPRPAASGRHRRRRAVCRPRAPGDRPGTMAALDASAPMTSLRSTLAARGGSRRTLGVRRPAFKEADGGGLCAKCGRLVGGRHAPDAAWATRLAQLRCSALVDQGYACRARPRRGLHQARRGAVRAYRGRARAPRRRLNRPFSIIAHPRRHARPQRPNPLEQGPAIPTCSAATRAQDLSLEVVAAAARDGDGVDHGPPARRSAPRRAAPVRVRSTWRASCRGPRRR